MRCLAAALLMLGCLTTLSAGGGDESSPASGPHSQKGAGPDRQSPSPSLAEARRQAQVLHTAMHSTLQIVHHRYYRENEGLPLPAATLTEVFADLEKEQQVSLRWLVVEGQAMNTDHLPESDFEHEAVRRLKRGESAHEQIDDNLYRHAGPITLGNHCLKCHVPDRKNTNDRVAGLIISIPLQGRCP